MSGDKLTERQAHPESAETRTDRCRHGLREGAEIIHIPNICVKTVQGGDLQVAIQ